MTLPLLPIEIINKILMIRPSHPVAILLKQPIEEYNHYVKSLYEHRFIKDDNIYIDFKKSLLFYQIILCIYRKEFIKYFCFSLVSFDMLV